MKFNCNINFSNYLNSEIFLAFIIILFLFTNKDNYEKKNLNKKLKFLKIKFLL